MVGPKLRTTTFFDRREHLMTLGETCTPTESDGAYEQE